MKSWMVSGAVWDGQRLMSRTGKRLNAPEWFVAGLPAGVWLDGELWLGRGRFQELAGVLRKKGSGWGDVLYMVFDSPGNGEFEERLKGLVKLDLPNHARLVDHVKIDDMEQFSRLESEMVAAGAEGVMVREPGSFYVFGRSQRLLKVKRWVDDEAEVLLVDEGRLLCSWRGREVKIQTGGVGCAARPGELVTFAYCGLTASGLPRHSAYIGVRDYE